MQNNNAMTMPNVESKKQHSLFSKPLFFQSFKSNLSLWLVLTLTASAIFLVVNLVVCTKPIFTNIDMGKVQQYVKDENMNWLQIIGLLETMGFKLSRIQVMTQLDLNSIINDLIYKIAGVLLPMIYVMIVANKLIATQVSDGSMAYVLSTPTNRKKVVRTQYAFLFVSLLAMYVVITIIAYLSGLVAFYIAPPKEMTVATFTVRTLLYCFASFMAMFALSGVCFGASSIFNKSNQSIAIGGGACVFAFVCCILGLFGNKVFVSVGVGVEAMNVFNYLTIFTLIDTDSMSTFAKGITGIEFYEPSFNWIWEVGILFAIGSILAFIGGRYFTKKDLPL